MLILDLADDLLHHVLHGDEAVGAAIFVNDEREMDARRLHGDEQIHRRHGGRYVEQAADEVRVRQ